MEDSFPDIFATTKRSANPVTKSPKNTRSKNSLQKNPNYQKATLMHVHLLGHVVRSIPGSHVICDTLHTEV